MFGRGGGGDVPDPSDIADPGLPEVPPARIFRVTRLKPGSDPAVIEQVEVEAHSLQFGGNILQFMRFAIIPGPQGPEPVSITVRGFHGWLDYEDIGSAPTIHTVKP